MDIYTFIRIKVSKFRDLLNTFFMLETKALKKYEKTELYWTALLRYLCIFIYKCAQDLLLS